MIVPDPNWHGYRKELYRFIASRIRDRESAEDIVHEVLIRAYTNREQLQDPGRLRAWLYGITRNAIVDHYRAQRPSEPLPEDLVEESKDQATEAARQLARCMKPLIQRLPEAYAAALTLADLEGIPQAEIAQRMDLSLSGAKSRIQRARVMLKNALLGCCKVELDHQGRINDFDGPEGCGSGCDDGSGKTACGQGTSD